MKIYFATAENPIHRKYLTNNNVKHILMSYFYMNNVDLAGLKKEHGFRIFIDSGGFTARRKNVDIDIHEYGQFLKDNKDSIEVAANLDVGSFKQQLENQKILETYYPVLPVYHSTEYFSPERDVLIDLIKRYEYIALGGMAVNATRTETTEFLNYCFKKAIPNKTKYHGFGISSFDRLKEYPFYSVDASTWISLPRYGNASLYQDLVRGNKVFCYKKKEDALKLNINTKAFETSMGLREELKKVVLNGLKLEKDITRLWEARGVNWK